MNDKISIRIFIYSVIFTLFGLICLRLYADTRIYTAPLCRHWNYTTAVLQSKTPIGACYFLVEGDKRVEEHWFNCENIEVSQTVDWKQADYSCD